MRPRAESGRRAVGQPQVPDVNFNATTFIARIHCAIDRGHPTARDGRFDAERVELEPVPAVEKAHRAAHPDCCSYSIGKANKTKFI